jgi:zinc/manganese transport system substrate-binding protein
MIGREFMSRPCSIVLLFMASAIVSSAGERPRIVTSFLPLYCWTANVAGTNATVENLLPPRAEPHEYAFTPGDARKLSQADLIVVNGLNLEGWLPKFLRSAPVARQRLVTVSAGLNVELIAGEHHHGHSEDEHASHANPHTWLDPQLAAHGVSNILVALQRIDPAHALAYATNAHAYIARLNQLDGDIRQTLASVTNRAMVTYHDAFPYFARRYGLEIAGVVEEVPEVNPTPKYLSRLRATMRERNINVIYVAPAGRTRVARRIADDLGVKLVELAMLETGALSPSAYEELMMTNALVLQKHLK